MATLLIGYDLTEPDRYDELATAIKALGTAWWHHLDSTWLVKTPLRPGEVRDRLKPYLGDEGELLVLDVSGRARAWTGFTARGSDWLRKNFS